MKYLKKIPNVLLTVCVSTISIGANAATVEGVVKYINGDYGTGYDYDGYKAEIKISPDDSKTYFPIEARDYNHKDGHEYNRLGFGVGHKFVFDSGYITPEVKLRSESWIYPANITDFDWLVTKTMYAFKVNDYYGWAGRFDLGIINAEIDKTDGGNNKWDQYFVELRPGLRLTPFSKLKKVDFFKGTGFDKSRIDLIMYYQINDSTRGGVESQAGGKFDLDSDKEIKQFRIETNFKYNNLAIGPYVRIPLSHKENSYYSTNQPQVEYNTTRLGLRLAYNHTKNFGLVADIYRDEKEFTDEFSANNKDSSSDIIEVGVKFKF